MICTVKARQFQSLRQEEKRLSKMFNSLLLSSHTKVLGNGKLQFYYTLKDLLDNSFWSSHPQNVLIFMAEIRWLHRKSGFEKQTRPRF